MNDPIELISLGAGVQSSTMSLMAACGEITPMPDGGIFADTQAEPKSVYVWLDWLEKQLPFPVHRVTQGSLETETLRRHERKDKTGYWVHSGIPHYSINADGSFGHGPRQCTEDYKLIPLAREARRLIKAAGARKAITWIGISLDEAHRMKPARVKYLENRWPLIELEMTRRKCLDWMAAKGFPTPPRSACVFCPYHSDREWRRLKTEEPMEFDRAVAFERSYQKAKAETVSVKGFKPFLHDSRKSLDKVDFSTEEERGQISLFGNDCLGMCGV